ncbi:MAG: hypothetical protein EAZ60_20230 [Oscillatoriales cyanobacterium]|nr:MAG: hypothetical protein EAZ83_14465 [Oscillatoriales cyanobacterium]TAF00031.1 MAG: hypothetical protein EAZ79_04005 [Oscillatoriales cyanobacterium]TAF19127.1 MAG: hypothetical protein EAZ73_16225 [Oscillatoriales cyanobacterium]TAF39612.1 MAG: hypothetical protein EAZ69_00470 [Oscillatoriales cyanobacterium]TAF53420.1 MAG: hypothetical protein EAZ60_20230 [Oscillatoriales cyanobacterium]
MPVTLLLVSGSIALGVGLINRFLSLATVERIIRSLAKVLLIKFRNGLFGPFLAIFARGVLGDRKISF